MVMVAFACLPQGGSVTDADPDMQRSDLQERQHPAAIFIPAPLTAKHNKQTQESVIQCTVNWSKYAVVNVDHNDMLLRYID